MPSSFGGYVDGYEPLHAYAFITKLNPDNRAKTLASIPAPPSIELKGDSSVAGKQQGKKLLTVAAFTVVLRAAVGRLGWMNDYAKGKKRE